MTAPGDIVNLVVDRTSNSGNIILKTDSDREFVLKNEANVEIGEEIEVRVLNNRYVSTPDWRSDFRGEPQNYNCEIKTEISRISNKGNAFATVPELSGIKKLFLGQIMCTVGTEVYAIVLDSHVSGTQAALCTDISLCKGTYISNLSSACNLPTSKILELREALRNGSELPDNNIIYNKTFTSKPGLSSTQNTDTDQLRPSYRSDVDTHKTDTPVTEVGVDNEGARHANKNKTFDDSADMSDEIKNKNTPDGPSATNKEPRRSQSIKNRESNEKELQQLREQAEQDATKNPSKIHQTSVRSQYQRSQAVRDYALARANGTCEACGDPAPFETKKGRPYLEVHHVEELSSGGSDTPDKVVALCPTCHMRIHYGKDGEVINQQIKRKLESGLAYQGS